MPADDLHGSGEFLRPEAEFRSWITVDGEPGPSGDGGYPAESGRYHLYISEACPWAHRAWIYLRLKELCDVISVSMVVSLATPQGWVFDNSDPRYVDHLHGYEDLYQVYRRARPDYRGRVTVPVLWDKQNSTIVSNESAEIVRMFNSVFDEITGNRLDLYPPRHRDAIDSWNERIYAGLNDGVYRAGFATTPDAHALAVRLVFETLDELEGHFETNRFLCGDQVTEADWRLFPTLARFDVAYLSAFGCNLRRLIDYPNLWAYTRDLYRCPDIIDTVLPDIYKAGYHSIPHAVGHRRLVPVGPELDFDVPPERGPSPWPSPG